MPVSYWFGYFISFAIYVYVIYTVIRVTVTAYRKARYWKKVGFAVVNGDIHHIHTCKSVVGCPLVRPFAFVLDFRRSHWCLLGACYHLAGTALSP